MFDNIPELEDLDSSSGLLGGSEDSDCVMGYVTLNKKFLI